MRTPEKETDLSELENVLLTRLDVQDPDSIARAVQQGSRTFGKVDVLVNNAGLPVWGIVEATPMAKIRHSFEGNILGVIETTKAVLPHFRANRNGTIINIGSLAGKVAFPATAPYNSVKFAVEGFTEALWYEMESIGVKVKARGARRYQH